MEDTDIVADEAGEIDNENTSATATSADDATVADDKCSQVSYNAPIAFKLDFMGR